MPDVRAPHPRQSVDRSPAAGGRDAPPRRLDSRDLMAGRSEVEIVHGPVVYRLRRTGQDKLILTK